MTGVGMLYRTTNRTGLIRREFLAKSDGRLRNSSLCKRRSAFGTIHLALRTRDLLRFEQSADRQVRLLFRAKACNFFLKTVRLLQDRSKLLPVLLNRQERSSRDIRLPP